MCLINAYSLFCVVSIDYVTTSLSSYVKKNGHTVAEKSKHVISECKIDLSDLQDLLQQFWSSRVI